MEIRSQPPFGANEQSGCQGTEAKRWASPRGQSVKLHKPLSRGGFFSAPQSCARFTCLPSRAKTGFRLGPRHSHLNLSRSPPANPSSMSSAFCRHKGLISPAGKNRSAESLTGDRWATFFWPQRGRNGALRGIQIGRSRGSRLLAGPGRPYGACRGGRSRGGGTVGVRGVVVEGGGRGVLGRGEWGRDALCPDACAIAGRRDLLVAQLAAPPALSISNTAI